MPAFVKTPVPVETPTPTPGQFQAPLDFATSGPRAYTRRQISLWEEVEWGRGRRRAKGSLTMAGGRGVGGGLTTYVVSILTNKKVSIPWYTMVHHGRPRYTRWV